MQPAVLRPGLLLRRHDVRFVARAPLLQPRVPDRVVREGRRRVQGALLGGQRRRMLVRWVARDGHAPQVQQLPGGLRRLDQPRRVRGGLRQRLRGERSGPRPRDDLLQRPEVHEPAVAAAAPEERVHRGDGHERELRREHRGHRLLVGVGGLRRRAVRVRAGGRQLAVERPRPALRRRRDVAARSDRALRRRPRRRRRRGRHPVHALVPLDLPGRARGARRDRGVHQLRRRRLEAVGHPVGVAARQDIEPPPRRPLADVAPRLRVGDAHVARHLCGLSRDDADVPGGQRVGHPDAAQLRAVPQGNGPPGRGLRLLLAPRARAPQGRRRQLHPRPRHRRWDRLLARAARGGRRQRRRRQLGLRAARVHADDAGAGDRVGAVRDGVHARARALDRRRLQQQRDAAGVPPLRRRPPARRLHGPRPAAGAGVVLGYGVPVRGAAVRHRHRAQRRRHPRA